MADTSSISISTAQWVKNSPYITLSVTKTNASNSTSYTYDWKLTYTAKYAASASQNKSYSVTIGGATSSGTFSINNKTGTHTIASGTRTIQRTQTTQTIAASASFAFNLTWSGVYAGTKSASKNIAIDPKPSYTVTYNLAGGIGTFNNQKKWYGDTLTLHTAAPSRTGYNFLGWLANNAEPVLTEYKKNAAATMYAKWEQSLQKPTITNLVIKRCTSDGTVDEVNGTYATATFDWSVDPSVSLVSLTVGGVAQQISTESHVETAPINGGFSTDNSYAIDVEIEDSEGQKLTVTGTLSSSKYPIDVHAGGDGVTIGGVAETAGFNVFMPTMIGKFGSTIHGIRIDYVEVNFTSESDVNPENEHYFSPGIKGLSPVTIGGETYIMNYVELTYPNGGLSHTPVFISAIPESNGPYVLTPITIDPATSNKTKLYLCRKTTSKFDVGLRVLTIW